MSRAPFQVLVIPFCVFKNNKIKYAVLKRSDMIECCWQFVAGGGEHVEEPAESARRESSEEIGSDPNSKLVKLDSLTKIPVVDICGFKWGNDVLVIPQYCFGIELFSEKIILSNEHTDFQWLPYEEARKVLTWESNKIALWELNHILTHDIPKILV